MSRNSSKRPSIADTLQLLHAGLITSLMHAIGLQ